MIDHCHGAADQAWSFAAVAAAVVFQTDRRRAAPFYVAGPCQAPDKRSCRSAHVSRCASLPDSEARSTRRQSSARAMAAIIGRASTARDHLLFVSVSHRTPYQHARTSARGSRWRERPLPSIGTGRYPGTATGRSPQLAPSAASHGVTTISSSASGGTGLGERRGGLEPRAFRNHSSLHIPPQINHQSPRDRDNANLAAPHATVGPPCGIPARQRTLRLKLHPTPGELDRDGPDLRVARTTDPWSSLCVPLRNGVRSAPSARPLGVDCAARARQTTPSERPGTCSPKL